MSYKFSTGSVRRGDLYFEDDRTGASTYIDFEQDTITLRPSGSAVLYAQHNRIGIGTTSPDYTLDVAGDIGVDQYIYHNGDTDTWIRFNDDDITFKAGNLTFLDIEKKGSAPHEITVNDGSNNIDFVVKGNGSNEGNPLFKCDASTGRVGINGVGSPDCELHVDGDIKLVGDDPRIKIDGDVDSHPGLELYENGTRKWIIYNNYTNDNFTFKTNSTIRMSIEQDGNVGIGTAGPDRKLDVLDASDPQLRLTHTDGSKYVDFQATSAGDLHITGSAANAHLRFISAENATVVIQSQHTGDSDAQLAFSVDDGNTIPFSLGVDDSDSDKFKIGAATIDTGTKMTITTGGNIGVGTTAPTCTLSVGGSMAMNVTGINSGNDPGTTYSVAVADCVILVNTRPTAQGGIDSALTITLPLAADYPGRVLTIKDAAGFCDVNRIYIQRAGSDLINAVDQQVTMTTPASFKTFISDGSSAWQEIAN